MNKNVYTIDSENIDFFHTLVTYPIDDWIKQNNIRYDNQIPNSSVEHTYLCRRCHRKITGEHSIKIGMGPTCYAKYISESYTNKIHKLF